VSKTPFASVTFCDTSQSEDPQECFRGKISRESPIFRIMPIPILAALVGAAVGSATKKTPKKKAVSGYKTKKGKKVKAYLKNA
jgi:hypothetical protein